VHSPVLVCATEMTMLLQKRVVGVRCGLVERWQFMRCQAWHAGEQVVSGTHPHRAMGWLGRGSACVCVCWCIPLE